MVICIQCSMKAMLADKPYAGEPDETITAHMARVHPDPAKTAEERRQLEADLEAKLKGR